MKNTPSVYVTRPAEKIYLPATLVLTILVFLPALFNGFTNWDDDVYVLNNPLIRDFSWDGIKALLFSYTGLGGTRLTLLNFLLDYQLFGLNPFFYHLENVIFHLFNVALVYWLFQRLFNRPLVSALTAVLFAVHPMHVESVAWVAERKDVLYTFFYLLSLISYHHYLKHPKKYHYLLYCFLLFFLSYHAKLSAASLPFMLLVLDYLQRRKVSLRLVLEKLPFLLFLLYTMTRIFTFHQVSGGNFHHLTATFSLVDKIFLAGYSTAFYLWNFVAPFRLSSLHPYPVATGGMLPVPYYIATIVVVLIGAVILWLVWKIKLHREQIFGLLFFVTGIAMYTHFVNIKGVVIVADRYSYLSYIGLGFIAAWQVDRFVQRDTIRCNQQRLVAILAGMVILLFSVLSFQRTFVWKDTFTLFGDVLQKDPAVAYAHNNIGIAKKDLGDLQGAKAAFTEALQLDPTSAVYYNNRGTVEAMMLDYPAALADFDRAVAIKPNYDEALFNRAKARKSSGDYNGALADLDAALAVRKVFPYAYLERAQERWRRGDATGALSDLTLALKGKPAFPEVYYLRGNIRKETGDMSGAMFDYTQVLKYQPDHYEALNNRGYCYNMSGQYQQALQDLDAALLGKKDFAEAHNNRGISLANLQDVRAALSEFDEAIRLQPDYVDALINRGNARGVLGDFEGSVRDFNAVLTIRPRDSVAMMNRGNSKYNAGDRRGACSDWQRAADMGFAPASGMLQAHCR